MVLFLLAAAGAFVADWGTKVLVLRHLTPGERIPLIPGILALEHVRNRGAAFGLLGGWPGSGLLFLLAGALALLLVAWFAFRRREGSFPFRHPLLDLAAGFLSGGILGNLVERVIRGEVTDFLALPYWPVFNLADVFIVGGGVGVAFFLLRPEFHRFPAR